MSSREQLVYCWEGIDVKEASPDWPLIFPDEHGSMFFGLKSLKSV
jgi:hypothetical protein